MMHETYGESHARVTDQAICRSGPQGSVAIGTGMTGISARRAHVAVAAATFAVHSADDSSRGGGISMTGSGDTGRTGCE